LKRGPLVIFVILLVLILDQWLKVYVKTSFNLGEGFNILGWSKGQIHFVENKGMAFGLELGGDYGKLVLSLFRIFMIGFLIYVVHGLIKTKESLGLLISFSLILAGAIGNMIDSAFYGIIFSASTYHGPVASFMPETGGYANFLYGKVVDMFSFPLVSTRFPSWFPFWGGEPFDFFKPIFNIADASIFTGVASILLFHRNFFKSEKDETARNKKASPSINEEEE